MTLRIVQPLKTYLASHMWNNVKHLEIRVYKCQQVLSDRCGSCHILSFLRHHLANPLDSHYHSSGLLQTKSHKSPGFKRTRSRPTSDPPHRRNATAAAKSDRGQSSCGRTPPPRGGRGRQCLAGESPKLQVHSNPFPTQIVDCNTVPQQCAWGNEAMHPTFKCRCHWVFMGARAIAMELHVWQKLPLEVEGCYLQVWVILQEFRLNCRWDGNDGKIVKQKSVILCSRVVSTKYEPTNFEEAFWTTHPPFNNFIRKTTTKTSRVLVLKRKSSNINADSFLFCEEKLLWSIAHGMLDRKSVV